MNDWLTGLKMVVMAVVLLAGMIFGIFIFEIKVKCPKFGNAVKLEHKYVLFGGGCFVKTETGQWVQRENYWNSPIVK